MTAPSLPLHEPGGCPADDLSVGLDGDRRIGFDEHGGRRNAHRSITEDPAAIQSHQFRQDLQQR
jgi:hypothetical protein